MGTRAIDAQQHQRPAVHAPGFISPEESLTMIDNLPRPTGNRLAVRLHPGAERAVRRGHPWVFAEAIQQQRREGKPGDLAVIFDRDNRFLAIGLYDPHSPIRLRILQQGAPESIDGEWFAARIQEAWERRTPLLHQETTGFRVIHGENDRLPGLVVDRYEKSVVVKLYTAAWVPHLREILPRLADLFPTERMVLRLSRTVQQVGGVLSGLSDGQVVRGSAPTGPVLFRENGLVFEADLVRGQKTGFFLDQRENRARVERLSDGRSVLNVFAYTGGFSLYAARGGARDVTSLDISQPALAAAQRNFRHNSTDAHVAAAKHHLLVGDAFEILQKMHARGNRYDLVILDPPSFAKAQAEIDRALASYRKLTRLGLGVLSQNGILVAASCSSRISAEHFTEAVAGAARQTGRPLHVFEQTGHAVDHPIGFAEGAYLKCMFATAR
jgi:23S rRNA (cytosine1962-C5)-methyltransferase